MLSATSAAQLGYVWSRSGMHDGFVLATVCGVRTFEPQAQTVQWRIFNLRICVTAASARWESSAGAAAAAFCVYIHRSASGL
jgi:hypothetical protein